MEVGAVIGTWWPGRRGATYAASYLLSSTSSSCSFQPVPPCLQTNYNRRTAGSHIRHFWCISYAAELCDAPARDCARKKARQSSWKRNVTWRGATKHARGCRSWRYTTETFSFAVIIIFLSASCRYRTVKDPRYFRKLAQTTVAQGLPRRGGHLFPSTLTDSGFL